MNLNLWNLRRQYKECRKKNEIASKRLLALIELAKRQKFTVSFRDLDFELVAEKFGVTGRTIRMWRKAYLRNGGKYTNLYPNKRFKRGRKKKRLSGWIILLIVSYRSLYNWGAETIQAHLLKDHQIKISRWKIHQILKSKNLLKKSRKRKIKNKHTQIVFVEIPGTHTQIDVKHLPHLLPNDQKCYVYNFIDHASKWEFKRAYESYGPAYTRGFMSEILQQVPFTIVSTQSDNGIEFTNKFISHMDDPAAHAFDLLCKEEGIRHRLIPPGEKEINGLVERCHRADDEELYHRIKPKSLKEFNQLLDEHCKFRNGKRRRKPLDWKTPNEVLIEKGYNLDSSWHSVIDDITDAIEEQETKKAA